MNICNTYNVTTIPITKCEIIFFFKKKKKNKTNKHTHTLKLTTCQTLKTFMTYLSSTTKQLKLSIILPNHNLPNLEEKKNIFPYTFSWETKKRKVVISLHNLLSDLLYQWHLFKQRQCLEGPNKICDTKWVEIVYDIIIYRHSFETWIVQRIVKGRCLRF